MRLRLDLAYDGTDFHGWAKQPGLRTVEDTLESGLALILRVPVPVRCAGRTDAGVHARGQVVHLDLDETTLMAAVGRARSAPADALLRRLNSVMSGDVRVLTAREAPAGFDARFSAMWRRYAYRIADRPDAVDPLTRRSVVAWPRTLDLDAMDEAAAHLLGEHDFAAFCKKRVGATTVRTLIELSWSRDDAGLVVASVKADAFCRNMVRALVGCMIAVGEGRKPPAWAAEVLANRVRDPAVGVLHAHGLTLEEVAYPRDEDVASRAASNRVTRTLPPEWDDADG